MNRTPFYTRLGGTAAGLDVDTPIPADDQRRSPMMVGVLSAALAAIGSFLPWATVGIFSKAGTDGDGVFTLVLGLIMAALFFGWGTTTRGRIWMLVSAACALIIVGIAAYDIQDVQSVAADAGGIIAIEVGSGLYVTMAGGLGGLLASYMGFKRSQPE